MLPPDGVPDDLTRQAHQALADLRHHKSRLRQHRKGAQEAKERLIRIEAECAARGIALVVVSNAAGQDERPGR